MSVDLACQMSVTQADPSSAVVCCRLRLAPQQTCQHQAAHTATHATALDAGHRPCALKDDRSPIA